jgi:hypothetical protein
MLLRLQLRRLVWLSPLLPPVLTLLPQHCWIVPLLLLQAGQLQQGCQQYLSLLQQRLRQKQLHQAACAAQQLRCWTAGPAAA